MVVFLVLLFHDHVTNQKPFPLGSPMPGRHIVKIEEACSNGASGHLLLPHQEDRSTSETSLTGDTYYHKYSH